MIKLEEVLKKNKLRKTSVRIEVLSQFHRVDYALSHHALEALLKEKDFDRVTLYRTLNSFEECDIIHKIVDSDGVARYALTKHNTIDHAHVHFECVGCNTVFCVHNETPPSFSLPEGFVLDTIAISAKGLCSKCEK